MGWPKHRAGVFLVPRQHRAFCLVCRSPAPPELRHLEEPTTRGLGHCLRDNLLRKCAFHDRLSEINPSRGRVSRGSGVRRCFSFFTDACFVLSLTAPIPPKMGNVAALECLGFGGNKLGESQGTCSFLLSNFRSESCQYPGNTQVRGISTETHKGQF